jgi:hypothetical protein
MCRFRSSIHPRNSRASVRSESPRIRCLRACVLRCLRACVRLLRTSRCCCRVSCCSRCKLLCLRCSRRKLVCVVLCVQARPRLLSCADARGDLVPLFLVLLGLLGLLVLYSTPQVDRFDEMIEKVQAGPLSEALTRLSSSFAHVCLLPQRPHARFEKRSHHLCSHHKSFVLMMTQMSAMMKAINAMMRAQMSTNHLCSHHCIDCCHHRISSFLLASSH